MMDRGTVRNMYSFIPNKCEKLVHLVGFIVRNSYIVKYDIRTVEVIVVTFDCESREWTNFK